MGRAKDRTAFRTGFQQRSAMVQQWQGSYVGWRLWSPRMGCLGRPPSPWARLLGLPEAKRPIK
jgi:hypothetical protein